MPAVAWGLRRLAPVPTPDTHPERASESRVAGGGGPQGRRPQQSRRRLSVQDFPRSV
jgi:hypothetical protein